jgi:hypothetical protein
MSSILSPSGLRPDSKIELRTRANTPIDNLQAWQYSSFEWAQLGESLKRFKEPYAKALGSPSPVYNCHGLTFASRRTAVDSSNETVFRVLKEDDYEEVPQSDARPGDVILYLDAVGQAQHSGIVVDIIERGVPKVWSKWGKGQEFIHHFWHCPFDPQYTKYYRLK